MTKREICAFLSEQNGTEVLHDHQLGRGCGQEESALGSTVPSKPIYPVILFDALQVKP